MSWASTVLPELPPSSEQGFSWGDWRLSSVVKDSEEVKQSPIVWLQGVLGMEPGS